MAKKGSIRIHEVRIPENLMENGGIHDSRYRCMLDDVTISMEDAGEPVSVDVAIVFFEYQQL